MRLCKTRLSRSRGANPNDQSSAGGTEEKRNQLKAHSDHQPENRPLPGPPVMCTSSATLSAAGVLHHPQAGRERASRGGELTDLHEKTGHCVSGRTSSACVAAVHRKSTRSRPGSASGTIFLEENRIFLMVDGSEKVPA